MSYGVEEPLQRYALPLPGNYEREPLAAESQAQQLMLPPPEPVWLPSTAPVDGLASPQAFRPHFHAGRNDSANYGAHAALSPSPSPSSSQAPHLQAFHSTSPAAAGFSPHTGCRGGWSTDVTAMGCPTRDQEYWSLREQLNRLQSEVASQATADFSLEASSGALEASLRSELASAEKELAAAHAEKSALHEEEVTRNTERLREVSSLIRDTTSQRSVFKANQTVVQTQLEALEAMAASSSAQAWGRQQTLLGIVKEVEEQECAAARSRARLEEFAAELPTAKKEADEWKDEACVVRPELQESLQALSAEEATLFAKRKEFQQSEAAQEEERLLLGGGFGPESSRRRRQQLEDLQRRVDRAAAHLEQAERQAMELKAAETRLLQEAVEAKRSVHDAQERQADGLRGSEARIAQLEQSLCEELFRDMEFRQEEEALESRVAAAQQRLALSRNEVREREQQFAKIRLDLEDEIAQLKEKVAVPAKATVQSPTEKNSSNSETDRVGLPMLSFSVPPSSSAATAHAASQSKPQCGLEQPATGLPPSSTPLCSRHSPLAALFQGGASPNSAFRQRYAPFPQLQQSLAAMTAWDATPQEVPFAREQGRPTPGNSPLGALPYMAEPCQVTPPAAPPSFLPYLISATRPSGTIPGASSCVYPGVDSGAAAAVAAATAATATAAMAPAPLATTPMASDLPVEMPAAAPPWQHHTMENSFLLAGQEQHRGLRTERQSSQSQHVEEDPAISSQELWRVRQSADTRSRDRSSACAAGMLPHPTESGYSSGANTAGGATGSRDETEARRDSLQYPAVGPTLQDLAPNADLPASLDTLVMGPEVSNAPPERRSSHGSACAGIAPLEGPVRETAAQSCRESAAVAAAGAPAMQLLSGRTPPLSTQVLESLAKAAEGGTPEGLDVGSTTSYDRRQRQLSLGFRDASDGMMGGHLELQAARQQIQQLLGVLAATMPAPMASQE